MVKKKNYTFLVLVVYINIVLYISVVSNAVDTLCDHTKRKMYDQTLRKPSTSTFNHYNFRKYFT